MQSSITGGELKMYQEFTDKVKDIINDNIRCVHTAMPGKILTFDPDTCLATVLPTMKYKMPDGKTMPYPQITGVPVMILETMNQQATIAFPIKPGDGCTIVVAEQALDYWQYGQETDTDLAFDLTNAICIPGLFVQPNQIVKAACEQNAIIVDVKGTKITVKKNLVQIDSKDIVINGDLRVNGQITASEDIIASDKISGTHHTHMGVHGVTSPPL